MKSKIALLCAALFVCSPLQAADAPRFDDAFWDHWGDGKAELAGYDLTYNRYGQSRSGVAISIFVTETFSNQARVKADPGMHPKSDEYPVMKLNLVKDYPTGIYDYNMMTSAFAALGEVNSRPAGSLTKVSFSSQEWCGHVYHQLLFDKSSIRETGHSYFDGEADRSATLPYPEGGISADALLHWARGFAGPVVGAGSQVERPLLGSLERSRMDHQELQWTRATLSRSAKTQSITVPAGTFKVRTASVILSNGLRYDFDVEEAFPRRVIRWRTNRGDEALLRGATRLPYWQLNGEGAERYLRSLGLDRNRTLPKP